MTNRTQGLMVGIAYQSVRQNIWGCRPPFLSLIITQIILKGCNSASCLCKMTWAGCLTSKLPDSDLQVSIVVRDTLHPGPSGCQATRTIRSRDIETAAWRSSPLIQRRPTMFQPLNFSKRLPNRLSKPEAD